MKRITADEVVVALRCVGRAAQAKEIAAILDSTSRAVATALRSATCDGRVHSWYKNGIARYEFRQRNAKPNSSLKPYREGYMAWSYGLELTRNPYEPGGLAHALWADGFNAAMEDAREEGRKASE